MLEYKTIIDLDGNVIDLCVMFIDGIAQYFEMKENYITIERYIGNYVKPKWNGYKWIETATEEEKQQYYNRYLQ